MSFFPTPNLSACTVSNCHRHCFQLLRAAGSLLCHPDRLQHDADGAAQLLCWVRRRTRVEQKTPPTINFASSTHPMTVFPASCSVEQRTSVTSNGLSKVARFDFEAFRFVQHRDQPKSSIYVHCIVRLCEPSKCQELLSVSQCIKIKKWIKNSWIIRKKSDVMWQVAVYSTLWLFEKSSSGAC